MIIKLYTGDASQLGKLLREKQAGTGVDVGFGVGFRKVRSCGFEIIPNFPV